MTKVVAALAAVLLLTGCASGHGPAQHQSSGDVGEPADADDADRRVAVSTLDTMTFEPGKITASAGDTVTFVIKNTGQVVHEFTLGNAAMQQEDADEMARMACGMADEKPNSISLKPGETKELTWRFGDGGAIEYACHELGHYQAGMRGQITIN